MESLDALLTAARRRCQAEDWAGAATLYRQVLGPAPDNGEALMLLGTLLAEAAPAEAEAFFARAAAIDPGNALARHGLGKIRQAGGDDAEAGALFEAALALQPDFAPALNDLGTSLSRLGRHQAALAVMERAVAAAPGFAAARFNQGLVLLRLERPEEATAALVQAVTLDPGFVDGWCGLAAAAQALGALAHAEEACRRALALDPDCTDAHVRLAEVLDGQHRCDDAEAERAEAARRRGVVVETCAAPEARVLIVGGSSLCNAPTRFLFDRTRLETITVQLLPGQATALDDLPPYDIVFNAIADIDGGAPFLAEAEAFYRRCGRPVLNPLARVAATRRDALPPLLAGISGLAVPATRRVARGDLGAIAPPFLIRPPRSHGGHDLARIEGPRDLAAYLERTPAAEFYATDFVDYRSGDGHWRKYRLVFVDGEPFPCHLAVGDDWLVHYHRTAMDSRADFRAEEEAFLADWRSAFRGAAGDAVADVARKLGLDYGGLDCGFTPDGRVLVFEANASMLVHLHDPADIFPYKHAHVPRIFAAIADMVGRRLSISA